MKNMVNEINNITNNEMQKLKDEINDKENQINKLKIELQNDKNDKKSADLNDIISVTFISTEQKMNNYKISCLKTDRFAEIEEKLYQEFEEFRETNNIFIVNGRIIYRFKKMSENNINNGDTIQLIKNA
jgi:molybdopterin converting factor small subunit